MFDGLEKTGWDVKVLNHGDVVAEKRFCAEVTDIVSILTPLRFSVANTLIKGGGGEADHTQQLAKSLVDKGWAENTVRITQQIKFDNTYPPIIMESATHKIDHLMGNSSGEKLALETEWNNKDEFYDRDFQNMRDLYERHIIELGIIITRGSSLDPNLEDMIQNYFQNEGLSNFDDFDRIAKGFVDPDGSSRFTFPTDKQKREINKRVDSGHSFVKASANVFKSQKFGTATTNWKKLMARIERQNAGRCPMICLGIPASIFD